MATFREDLQSDIEDIIDLTDEFSLVATHTPKGGGDTTTFNVILGERMLYGDDEAGGVTQENVAVTAKSLDVTSVRYRDTLTINSVEYQVVNDPVQDSVVSAVSVIFLRRLHETKI